MEEDEKGDREQIYDEIEDSDKENSKSGKVFKAKTTAAGASTGKKRTFVRADSESGDKKNILHKLREKFSRKPSEDFTNRSGLQEKYESLHPFGGGAGIIVEDDMAARRGAMEQMHQQGRSVPSPSTTEAVHDARAGAHAEVSKPRLKTFGYGIRGSWFKTWDMLVHDINEHAESSCDHLSSSCLFNLVPLPDPIENGVGLCTDGDDPPPLPDRPLPVGTPRRRSKSVTLPVDQSSFSEVNVNFQKSTTSATEQSNGNLSPLTENLEKLSHYNWYWGPLSRFEAEEKLQGKPDGSFLVRDSSHEFHLYSVSLRSKGRTFHTRIRYIDGWFGFMTPVGLEPKMSSVVALMMRSMKISQRGTLFTAGGGITFPSYPIRFLLPVSRFEDLPSLQHICRFVIRQNSRCDKLHELPLPPKLIRYLDVNNHFLPENELE